MHSSVMLLVASTHHVQSNIDAFWDKPIKAKSLQERVTNNNTPLFKLAPD